MTELLVADEAFEALRDAQERYAATRRWRFIRRFRLLNEIERRLERFEVAEAERRVPPKPRDAAASAQPVAVACINARCRREHPEPATRLLGPGLSGSRYRCGHCGTTW